MRLARVKRSMVVVAATMLLTACLAGSSTATALAAAPSLGSDAWIVLLRPGTGTGSGVAENTADSAANLGQAPHHVTQATQAATAARAHATDVTIDRLETSLGFTAALRYHWALQGFAAVLSRAQVAALRLEPSVSLVTPDAPASPAGPGRQPVGIDIRRINAIPAAAGAAADADVDVAVIDTGIGSAADPTLGGELNVVDGTSCLPTHPGDTSDGYGHGTHVSGTIGARDNAIGVVGVAPGARLHPVRVFDSRGLGSTATVICGIDWATAWKVADPTKPLVANMSLRGFDTYHGHTTCADPATDHDPEHIAVCAGFAAGVVFVVAAGNESDDAADYIPARYPQVITVSAISDFDGLAGGLGSQDEVSGCVPPSGREHDDAFARYSNFGAVVDITAPGTCVRSTAVGPPGATRLLSGTSMATPHVTGAVARYLALNPLTAPEAMRQLLISSGDLGWDTATDPDGQPDRLLDVASLLGSAAGLAVWAMPTRVVLQAGTTQATFAVRLQRIGAFTGPVSIAATGLPPDLGSVTLSPDSLDGIAAIAAVASVDVATDAPDGDYPLTITASGPGGTPTAATEVTLRVDHTAPVIAAPWPKAVLRSGGTFSVSAPARLSWSATDGSPEGVAHLELQRRIGATGAWSSIASGGPSLLAARVALLPGIGASFRVRAADDAGNLATSSVLVTGVRLRQSDDPAVSWSKGWASRQRGSASGGSLRTSSSVGATADLRFNGRGVAVVAPTGHGKGSASISIDGQVVATVDLSSPSSHPRRIVFASDQLAVGSHDVRIEVLSGTVDVDALLILR